MRVELPNPEFEGKAERIGMEETSRVAYDRGGCRRLVVAPIVYKETVLGESATTDGGTAAGTKPANAIIKSHGRMLDRISTAVH